MSGNIYGDNSAAGDRDPKRYCLSGQHRWIKPYVGRATKVCTVCGKSIDNSAAESSPTSTAAERKERL